MGFNNEKELVLCLTPGYALSNRHKKSIFIVFHGLCVKGGGGGGEAVQAKMAWE